MHAGLIKTYKGEIRTEGQQLLLQHQLMEASKKSAVGTEVPQVRATNSFRVPGRGSKLTCDSPEQSKANPCPLFSAKREFQPASLCFLAGRDSKPGS